MSHFDSLSFSHHTDTPPLLSLTSLSSSQLSSVYPVSHRNLWTNYISSPPPLSSHQNLSPVTMTTASTVGIGRHYSTSNQSTTTYMYTNSSPMVPVPTYSSSSINYKGDGKYETPMYLASGNFNSLSTYKCVQQEESKFPSCCVMPGITKSLSNDQGPCNLPTPDLTPEFDAATADSSSVFF